MSALGLALFAAMFVGMWLGVCFLIGIKWRAVAGRYPAPLGRPEGRGFVAIRGILAPGGARYKRCLEVVPGTGGIYVAVKWPFNVAQEPMLVPWLSLRRMEVKEGWIGGRYLEVELALEGTALQLDFAMEAEEALRAHGGTFLLGK